MGGLGLVSRRRAIASSPTAGKGVEDILTHLCIHYSPRLQEATNESLKENKVLLDLSGNGFNLNLTGFTFDGVTDGIMEDASGEKYLRFVKSPVTRATNTFKNSDFPMSRFAEFTLICRREWYNKGANEYICDIRGGSSNYKVAFLEYGNATGVSVRSIGDSDVAGVNVAAVFSMAKQNVYMTRNSYCGLVELDYNENYNGNLGAIYLASSGSKGSFGLYDLMLFDKELTEKEINLVLKYFGIED